MLLAWQRVAWGLEQGQPVERPRASVPAVAELAPVWAPDWASPPAFRARGVGALPALELAPGAVVVMVVAARALPARAQVVVVVAAVAPAQAGAVVPASEEVAVAVAVAVAPAQAEAVVPASGEAEVAVRVARAQPVRAQGPVAEAQPALAQTPVLTWLALARVVKQLLESGFVRRRCWVVESDASDR